jgi:UDP-N-acetylglucosamine:LPS N-acetylglucosamine transferase
MKRILAVASGGGHWSELMLIREAFEGGNVKYVTTIDGLPQEQGFTDFNIVCDANETTKIAMVITLFQLLKVISTYNPHKVIATGAYVGAIAIFIGKLFRAKTIWVESIANTNKLSLSGKFAKPFCDTFVVQWPNLCDGKSVFHGQVI